MLSSLLSRSFLSLRGVIGAIVGGLVVGYYLRIVARLWGGGPKEQNQRSDRDISDAEACAIYQTKLELIRSEAYMNSPDKTRYLRVASIEEASRHAIDVRAIRDIWNHR